MSLRRRKLNIALLVAALILGGWAAWLFRRPPLVLSPGSSGEGAEMRSQTGFSEDGASVGASDVIVAEIRGNDGEGTGASGAGATGAAAPGCSPTPVNSPTDGQSPATDQWPEVDNEPRGGNGLAVGNGSAGNADADSYGRGSGGAKGTRIGDVDVRSLAGNSTFAKEALKVLNGGADEVDSVSRHRILSYCEHLRTAYTTRDIDFIRQVFSEDALIIVGHVVKTDDRRNGTGTRGAAMGSGGVTGDAKVKYSVRSKREYLDRLLKLFNSGKEIKVKFSDFRIMRHPTLPGIYGVTLRQGYKAGGYEDDGYLFLLWDFRDRSMPLIHVRTWQPAKAIAEGEDMIDISDFNLN